MATRGGCCVYTGHASCTCSLSQSRFKARVGAAVLPYLWPVRELNLGRFAFQPEVNV